MKVGDLVRFGSSELALIVDIDPLQEDNMYEMYEMYEYDKINEIVVLRSDGGMWYTNPAGWEVVSEAL